MKLFNKIALTAVGAFMAVGAGVSALNIKAKSASAATMSVVSMSCDFTTKSAKSSAYNAEWAYGDFKVFGGANNNGGWDYVKMGGKKATLETTNPVYVASPKATEAIDKIEVVGPAGSMAKSGMTGADVYVVVYSDSEYKVPVDTTESQAWLKTANTYTFTPTTAYGAASWAKDLYYKVFWQITNTGTDNGVVWVSKINYFSTRELVAPDTITLTASSTMNAGETATCTTVSKKDGSSEGVDQTVTWSVTNGTGAATITEDGKITALSAGTVTVKAAYDESVYAEVIVTISGKTDDSALLVLPGNGLPEAYGTAAVYGVGGVAFEAAQVMKSGDYIQLKKSEGYFRNISALPKNIYEINVTFKEGTPIVNSISVGATADSLTSVSYNSFYGCTLSFKVESGMQFFRIDAGTSNATSIAAVSVVFRSSDEAFALEAATSINELLDSECAALAVQETTWNLIKDALKDEDAGILAVLDGSNNIYAAKIQKFLDRYDYIVAKYGYADFLGRGVSSSRPVNPIANSNAALLVAAGSICVIAAFATLILLKRKKFVK